MALSGKATANFIMREIEDALGIEAARLLSPLGIETLTQFVEQYSEKQQYKALAKELGIPSIRVVDWLQRADIFRVRGIGPGYVGLFAAARIRSVEEIAALSATQLHAKLSRVNRQRRLVRRVPSVSMLSESVAHAATLVSS